MITHSIPMRDALLEKIYQSMKTDSKIFFLSADFGSPVLDKIRLDFADRFINVGIAEQNLINIAAGLAIEGNKVFAYAIAPFLTMRCYEQIRVNLALLSQVRDMNVSLIGVGAGYSYVVSGPTHQCYEDISIMRALPSISVYSPADHISTGCLFDRLVSKKGIKYIRLDAQTLPVIYENPILNVEAGFNVHRKGDEICLLATGYMVHVAMKLANRLKNKGVDVGVVDIFDISHSCNNFLYEEISKYRGIVTMEEGFKGRGGMDSMILDYISNSDLEIRVKNIGVRGGYSFDLGSRSELHEKVGIGEEASLKTILEFHGSITNYCINNG
ncbi:transketolase family protein [Chromobacterium sp. IIBBL 290-4]|uniref:transketolase family protein n=1 Tax=Chromobacterium sp. IIBBL 290-4 TaxID=2953890 RepID=UPI0020B6D5CA|nr:transketolase C-terminal domain-containing protein [Chromobacterium sp. IIBBL 290-4]UTH72836.1 hypothetical protein NKT35_14965 [Chromobacterium sp. IIBBL 290-4]